ncbi:MAG: DUF2249 domain-containing protein [Bacillota bacterium]|nr:DUF2249 domain-containing protein [Bacillota bacterium]
MGGNWEAARKMEAHHREMVETLKKKVDQLEEELRQGKDPREACRPVAVYFEETIFPHAQAEEETLYQEASTHENLRLLVASMVREHQVLQALHAELLKAADPWHVYAKSRLLEALFSLHAERENEDLLPHLAADETVFLEEVLAQMADLFHKALPQGKGEEVELDVRELPHFQRHAAIFSLLERLPPGQSLVIVNDHDPKPLFYQIQALYADTFSWSYQKEGPVEWRVAIRRQG